MEPDYDIGRKKGIDGEPEDRWPDPSLPLIDLPQRFASKLKPRLIRAGIKLAEAALALRQLPAELSGDFEFDLGEKLDKAADPISLDGRPRLGEHQSGERPSVLPSTPGWPSGCGAKLCDSQDVMMLNNTDSSHGEYATWPEGRVIRVTLGNPIRTEVLPDDERLPADGCVLGIDA